MLTGFKGPGSFVEVSKMLPLLAKPKDGEPAFDIVAPSLPNFGFSQGIKKKGFMLPQYAESCHKLMLKLGYPQYGKPSPPPKGPRPQYTNPTLIHPTILVTQGGDWGFWITRTISRLYPSSCLASHLNMIVSSPPAPTASPLLALTHALTPYTAAERAGLERSRWFEKEGSHYGFLQASKPQTLGYALADSPVALLAWIYEKLHDWTDNYPWTDDEILTWICLYLFSAAGPAASLRIYYEALHEEGDGSRNAAMRWLPGTLLGLAQFPRDIYVYPRVWGRGLGKVVFERERESGGHFAAWERPEWVVADLKEMFGKGGGALGVVGGRSGFD